ncbi:MAG: ATP-dependent helicase HrpB [Prevotella sp.]
MSDKIIPKIRKCMSDGLSLVDRLPVWNVVDEVNGLLAHHPSIVLTAPPGAGKSTLLPLTVLDAVDEGRVVVVEPRRIAAIQIAERMSAMIGETVGNTVGYRVRFDTKVSASTRIEVITEGILLRLLVDDPTLDGISVVMFDEFHERSLASDTALALVREAQGIIRPDLHMVIMSATIDTDYICSSLNAPLVESQGRMYDVEILHGEEATVYDCASQMASAIMKAHREQQGDILAFLPGQAEIMRCREILGDSLGSTSVLPLYGMLTPQQQRRAIMPSNDGERKLVLATSIAETSLTIEGVRVVVDSGFCRRMVFDPRSGLSHLDTLRISLDMARQRTGRAGRVGEGVCYRLWSLATEHRMDDCRKPEIVEADLSSVLLDISAWGAEDIMSLPWLTPPPQSNVAQARQLLLMLEAIDDNGKITPHGKRLASLPCHPRIAQMLLSAETDSLKALAADIAAILEERDILNTETDADINTRIALLRDARRTRRNGRWGRIINIAEQYRRLVRVAEDNDYPSPYDSGRLIASAYPERIAVSNDDGKYKLANGNTVTLDSGDDLIACPLLAVASLGTRIFLASPLSKDSLTGIARWTDNVFWDSKQGRVAARRELRIGAVILDSRPIDNDVRERITDAICLAARKDGLSMFSFSDSVQALQRRITVVSSWHPELSLPDVSIEAVLSSVSEWLPLYIGKAYTTAELRKINMQDVIWGMLTYEQQTTVDTLAPTHISVPTGSRIRVDYRQGAEAPVLSVRLQECFGLTSTPCVDGGKRPVLMELLSPGFKPVQLTQDLANFWQSTYFEVRKELRRRYPKHHWPDNPLEAQAVRGVKR